MKSSIAILASAWVIAACAAAATAGDNLHPETSAWGTGRWNALNGYGHEDERFVSEIEASLPEAFSANVKVRVIEVSYLGIWAIGLKETAGKYDIFAYEPKEWTFTTFTSGPVDHPQTFNRPHQSPHNLRNTKVDRCELRIDRTTGDRIVQVWKGMLLRTTYVERLPADPGGAEHYAMTLEGQSLAGQAWISEPGRTRDFAQLALTMNEFCQKKSEMVKSKLNGELTDLLRKLRWSDAHR